MNIQDIITEFGAYYMPGSENMNRLIVKLYARSVTDTVLNTRVTDATLWRAAEASIGSILQPFQKDWTPKGEATLTPLSIGLFKMKIDCEEHPDSLEETWAGFLADNSLDRKTWPFVRWFVEVLMLPKAKEEYELEAIYFGKRKEPVKGTPGEAFEVMNGIHHLKSFSWSAFNRQSSRAKHPLSSWANGMLMMPFSWIRLRPM